jgi:ParB family chromosome partitioning protein
VASKRPASPPKPSGRRTRGRTKVTLAPTELTPSELLVTDPSPEVRALATAVSADGGAVLSTYREPLGGHVLLLVALPEERVAPTPFQRDVSAAHVGKLVRAIGQTKRFLDPIILVREGDRYLTPNGHHRLAAVRELGGRFVIGLLVPERAVAYQILALNIEKAHNLRERALEVQRMYIDLGKFADQSERDCELELEEPALVTLGFGYADRPRLSGGAYHPALRKVDSWLEGPLADALAERQRRAHLLLELDDAVEEVVRRLKERGLTSPYLKSFVVARVNPLRFVKGELPGYDDLLATMTRRAKSFKVETIQPEDVARSGGAPEEE